MISNNRHWSSHGLRRWRSVTFLAGASLTATVGSYVDAYDEQPLPVPVADRAYQRLLELMAANDAAVIAG